VGTLVFIAVVVVLAVIAAIVGRSMSKRSADGVANFRRQIDALSPEARQTTKDRDRRDQPRDDGGVGGS
jgi:hypothetical protein